MSSHGTGVGGVRAATGQLPAGLVPSVFFIWCQVRDMGHFRVWASEEKEIGKKYKGANLFFPCLCMCRGRRRIVPF